MIRGDVPFVPTYSFLTGPHRKWLQDQLFFNQTVELRRCHLTLPLKSNNIMPAISVVIALFVLAIVSPWIFPNKMVSKNEHDIKH